GLDDQLRPEPGAAVADLDRGAAARRPRDDGYLALPGVPDGVVDERAQQAGDLVAVGGEHEPGRHVDAERDRLPGGTAREGRAAARRASAACTRRRTWSQSNGFAM